MGFMRSKRSAAPAMRQVVKEPEVVNTEERAEEEVKAKRKNRTRVADTYTAGAVRKEGGSDLRKTLG